MKKLLFALLFFATSVVASVPTESVFVGPNRESCADDWERFHREDNVVRCLGSIKVAEKVAKELTKKGWNIVNEASATYRISTVAFVTDSGKFRIQDNSVLLGSKLLIYDIDVSSILVEKIMVTIFLGDKRLDGTIVDKTKDVRKFAEKVIA